MRYSPLLLLVLILLVGSSCKKENEEVSDLPKRAEQLIKADVGGTLVTSDSLRLVIPSNALPFDATLAIERKGSESQSVPNESLMVIGKPFTVLIPVDSLVKPITLEFPKPLDFEDSTKTIVYAYNGSTYYPMQYSVNNDKITVIVDNLNWELYNKKSVNVLGEIIFGVLVSKQTPPADQMGLKEVHIISGTMSFNPPQILSSSNKVLLFVHGWTGDGHSWYDFLNKAQSDTRLHYDKFWTFTYNSSLGINYNAQILAGLISTYAQGAEVDIVAHSMGGLVSRAMIENYNGASQIHKLITLGTPHKGSPLAVFRYIIGAFIGYTSDEILYNVLTQGFKDLNTFSPFINGLANNPQPSVPYFTIACTNDPSKFPALITSNLILSGPDDGVVAQTSSLGVDWAVSPSSIIEIPVPLAHLDMRGNNEIYEQTISFLEDSQNLPTVTTSEISFFDATTATSGGNITDDGGASVTSRGVCWSTSENPTINDNHTSDGTGIGAFTSSITGLTPNTPYYVRAYAINSAGTGYGDQVSFTTSGEESFYIGQEYGGGVIFYIDNTGKHGLIAATEDQSSGISWYNGSYVITGATGTAIGTGNSNSEKILDTLGNGYLTSYAAEKCYLLWVGYYGDWFLPSKDELKELFNLTGQAKLDENSYYWSSTESGGSGFGSGAWYTSKYFSGYGNEYMTARVRAVREF